MKIYMYSSDTYSAKGWYKIGQTERDADTRIKEQDTTSNPEPLKKIMEWSVPAYITDNDIHDLLIRQGFNKTRTDANREWFEIIHEDPVSVVHEAILCLDEQFKSQPQTVIVSDNLWLQQYESNKNLDKVSFGEEVDKVIEFQREFFEILNKKDVNKRAVFKNIIQNIEWFNFHFARIDKYSQNDPTWQTRKVIINDFKESAVVIAKANESEDDRFKATMIIALIFIIPLLVGLFKRI